jgi:hypothetical protein
LVAVQLIKVPPVLVRVYEALIGLNGPPMVPVEVNPVAGVTLKAPAIAFTVRLTLRVVFPLPSVVLVKVTVSL